MNAATTAPTASHVGHGSAFGAVSILNATATGFGCALAVASGSQAEWQWAGNDFVATTPGADDRLARAVWARLRARSPQAGARVTTASRFPPARGLKSSSSVAGALVRAALHALGEEPPWMSVATTAVDASLDAKVSLTGAFDDQVAVLCGGAHLTDNGRRQVVASFPVPEWHIAVWVPEEQIPKSKLAGLDASPLRPLLEPLRHRLDAETLPAAMTANGRIFHAFYAAHGLPVSDQPARTALEHGALGAGLSGTGPAVAAIFRAPTNLPVVAGGRWNWTRAVGGSL